MRSFHPFPLPLLTSHPVGPTLMTIITLIKLKLWHPLHGHMQYIDILQQIRRCMSYPQPFICRKGFNFVFHFRGQLPRIFGLSRISSQVNAKFHGQSYETNFSFVFFKRKTKVNFVNYHNRHLQLSQFNPWIQGVHVTPHFRLAIRRWKFRIMIVLDVMLSNVLLCHQWAPPMICRTLGWFTLVIILALG